MKKLIVILFIVFSGAAYGQLCETFDTVRNNSATLVTYNSARINGTIDHIGGGQIVSLQLKYVRIGFTDTVTSSGLTPLRNITGLVASTNYYYYYKTICPSGSRSQTIGGYYFTTATSKISYVDERPTRFHYAYIDSVLQIGAVDTSLYRAPEHPSIVYKASDDTYYAYHLDCACWQPLAIDSAGIIDLINQKVDSVTVSGDSLFYWVQGVSYGYILPVAGWALVGNSGTDTATNWIGTNDNEALKIRTNGVDAITINTAQAVAFNNSYGTTGQLLKTVGSSGTPVWTDYTFQNALTAGSVLSSPVSITGAVTYTMTDFTSFNLIKSGDTRFQITAGITALRTSGSASLIQQVAGTTSISAASLLTTNASDGDHSTEIHYYPDTLQLHPSLGNLYIDTLNNETSQNSLMGWTTTSGANRGKVGYITLGTGLSLSSGVLSAAASGLTVGTSPIASGTTTRILYDNAGVLGEYTLTGTGTVVAMQTSPSFVTSVIGGASFDAFNTVSTTLNIGGAATTMTIGGTPTTAITHNYSTNATAAATTKTINFGTGGAASSTTNINIGDADGGTTIVNSPLVGMGVSPTSQLHTTSFGAGYHFVDNADYTVLATDHVISVTSKGGGGGAGGGSIITLPDAANCTERIYVVKFYDNSSTTDITIAPVAGNIQDDTGNYATTFTIGSTGYPATKRIFSCTYQSNGTDWELIATGTRQ